MTDALDHFDAKTAGEAIESFVDQLSNWYVRRNRRRFWKSTDPEDKQAAYLTLVRVPQGGARTHGAVRAVPGRERLPEPRAHGRSDARRQRAHGELARGGPAWQNDELLFDIGVVQKVVGLGRAARGQSGVRTRQPLSRLLVRAPNDAAAQALESHQDQILEELNVKAIEFIARDAGLVSYSIKPNLPTLGKQYGKLMPEIRKALRDADGAEIAGAAARGEAFEIEVTGRRFARRRRRPDRDALGRGLFVRGGCRLPDGARYDAQRRADREGRGARDRALGAGRAQAGGSRGFGSHHAGRVGLRRRREGARSHRDYVMNETLATTWEVGQAEPGIRPIARWATNTGRSRLAFKRIVSL